MNVIILHFHSFPSKFFYILNHSFWRSDHDLLVDIHRLVTLQHHTTQFLQQSHLISLGRAYDAMSHLHVRQICPPQQSAKKILIFTY